MKKIAIIGASYLQAPLIIKAKEMGIETHVFAWAANDVGESLADYFYPISIVEKEQILEKCQEINIDGICSIASDLAMITVNFVAQSLGLISNSIECTTVSTNKHLMRMRFEEYHDPSPKSLMVEDVKDLSECNLHYPVIVKPLDRSGSRGITKVYDVNGLQDAIEAAKSVGFDKHALVEEFAEGEEYSVEYISWKGKHSFLALTKKYTTGAPHFIEKGHIQPADVSQSLLVKVKAVVEHALTSLGIEYGASHTELKIDSNENILLIEIGGRMGGDFIGSDLVQLSTGYDFVKAVIAVAMGECPAKIEQTSNGVSAVRFIMNSDDAIHVKKFVKTNSKLVVRWECADETSHEVVDSGSRFGYCLVKANLPDDIDKIKILLN